MGRFDNILAKHEDDGIVPLTRHLEEVAKVAVVIARNLNVNETTARKGALLHDIGKVSPEFQKRLKHGYVSRPGTFFRHEIASLFFISLVNETEKDATIEMIAAHHKSACHDVRSLGLIDLDDKDNSFEIHIKDFEIWSTAALEILSDLGFETHAISVSEAKDNYEYSVDYCRRLKNMYSQWKGILMAADHFSSALNNGTFKQINKLYIKPDLSFYNRINSLYPLSEIDADDKRMHTIVTAPTGAGKTDFLLRRCQGRVFYTLPFQASINAMYDRIKNDLKDTDAQIYLLHSASNLKLKDGTLEERIMQRHIGASVKILTPHQMASIVYGIKGYESMAIDLKGCDVILDEIHTYSDVIQAIVLKIIEVLIALDCRIHIGTATMPTVLYSKILDLLGGSQNVYEIILDDNTLSSFNRHIIHKVETFEKCQEVIERAIEEKQKILIVCNQVKTAQSVYFNMKSEHPDIEMMLIHSRFKRGHRQELEKTLKDKFNKMKDSCIVVSTQVVEVSLDISFDVMITACAPIDAMIQRFGRINRVRTKDTIGKFKDVYVIAPPESDDEARPYSLDILKRSYSVLLDNQLLEETDVQTIIDKVYYSDNTQNIEYTGIIFSNGHWMLKELCHKAKSALLETLDIDSAVCVTENDKNDYMNNSIIDCSAMEIPVSYRSIAFRNLSQLKNNLRPFIIPDKAYSQELGYMTEFAEPEYYNSFDIL